MGRDLLTSPYGRFYYVPRLLARRGHDVSILLCSYKNEPAQFNIVDVDGIHWSSISVNNLFPFRYYQKAHQFAKEMGVDWIVGLSDTYYGIIAVHLANLLGCKSLVDAYDNYESYLPWCKPLHYLWRRALAKADFITAAGPQLLQVMSLWRPDKSGSVISMTADPIGFVPMDRIACRRKLGLPLEKKIMGYCGSLHKNRGADILFEVFREIFKVDKNITMVLSGRRFDSVSMPEGVRHLGFLPEKEMPVLLNSMDLLTVINKKSSFGNFSYPVKLYEGMSCQIPVVASRTDSVGWILRDFPLLLAEPENKEDLMAKMHEAMNMDRVDYGVQQGWERAGELFEKILLKTI